MTLSLMLFLAFGVLGGVAGVVVNEYRKANRERVDRLTWYWYLTSASSETERAQRAQEFLAYSKTAKWT